MPSCLSPVKNFDHFDLSLSTKIWFSHFPVPTMATANGDSSKTPPVDPDAVLPQLKEHEVTYGEIRTAIRVLNAIASLRKEDKGDDEDEDGMTRYKHTNLRPFRKALAGCLELHKRTMFQGKDEETHYEQRMHERSLKRQKIAERDKQKQYIAATALRKGRVEKLKALQDDAKEEEEQRLLLKMVPDGHVETPTLLLQAADDDVNDDANQHLPKLRSCYVCKVRFRELHHFYDQLCPTCAALNWEKRHQTADLHGKLAVVTGARVKIGLQTTLKLLRAGCRVVATTRFPNAATDMYRQQADFDQWKDQLRVYGLDLRDVSGMEAFTRFLKLQYGTTGIDILINNACQTIRRPAGYYTPMVEKEQALWKQADETHKAVLGDCLQFERARRKILLDHKRASGQISRTESDKELPSILESTIDIDGSGSPQVEDVSEQKQASTDVVVASTRKFDTDTESFTAPFETTGVSHSTAMSQMIILPEDAGVSDSILPPGITDINGQQLDLRKSNSWLLKMEEVSTPEIMECMFVNAIAPFVLNSRLKPLMTIPVESRPDRYIINVSAMEGKFYRYKMPNHPHTNMAKAALNMLTRTSAEDLSKKFRIFMNSVDTGWINDENPLERASRTAEQNSFQTPIDEIDAAARILDPIFVGVNGGRELKKLYGKFLKDYRETEW